MLRTAQLPLFVGDREPSTVAELETALDLVLQESTTDLMHTTIYAPRLDPKLHQPPLSETVRRLSASFYWDMYHEQPCRTLADARRRSLSEFNVAFQSDWGACAVRLHQRYGAPNAVAQRFEARVFAYVAYGPFFAAPLPNGAFSLTYHKKIPDWALPPVDVSSKEHFLRSFGDALSNAQGHSDALAAASLPPPRSGVLVHGPSSYEDFRLELAPAMPALELARIWGWQDAIGVSLDVHMSSWTVKLVSRSARGLSTLMPTFGRWEVEARLEGWPSGEQVEGLMAGPVGHRHLTAKDTVRHLSITLGGRAERLQSMRRN